MKDGEISDRGPKDAPALRLKRTPGGAGTVGSGGKTYDMTTVIERSKSQPSAKLRTVPPSSLQPWERNSRVHDVAQLEALCRSLSEFGLVKPIVVDEELRILAGHGICEAAKLLELEEVPVVVVSGLSEVQKRAYVVADNRLAEIASWDSALLEIELGDLKAIEFDLRALGYGEWAPGAPPEFEKPNVEVKHRCLSAGMSFRVASLFSGCGGSSLGYKMAGFEVVYASEFVPAAAETYRANFPDTRLDTRDIRDVSPADLPEVDVLDGSPPCQSFSQARQKFGSTFGKVTHYSDVEQRTDDLFFEYVRVLRGVMPKIFVAENVTGLARGPSKGYFLRVERELRASGYRVDCRIVDASLLGVPQARRRVIFVGVREDLGADPVYPKPQVRRSRVSDFLRHIRSVKAGGGFLRYRSADLPCPTVTAMGYSIPELWSFSAGNFVETTDGERRLWTIDELKVVCGFPRDFVLTGTEEQQWERLGRAVPPPMMAAIAGTIRTEILERLEEAA